MLFLFDDNISEFPHPYFSWLEQGALVQNPSPQGKGISSVSDATTRSNWRRSRMLAPEENNFG